VIATGPFQIPFVPPIAEGLGPEVEHLHSTKYRSPQDMPEGRVLVVGGGNTGYQIAAELTASHEVHISIGSPQKPLPQRILGRDLFWYLDKTGVIRKPGNTRIGRRLQANDDTLIGSSPRSLRRHGVEFHRRSVEAAGSAVSFSDKVPPGTVHAAAIVVQGKPRRGTRLRGDGGCPGFGDRGRSRISVAARFAVIDGVPLGPARLLALRIPV
jgi:cation diffusion facilitator CzcD-associated flavoprotein CzcO